MHVWVAIAGLCSTYHVDISAIFIHQPSLSLTAVVPLSEIFIFLSQQRSVANNPPYRYALRSLDWFPGGGASCSLQQRRRTARSESDRGSNAGPTRRPAETSLTALAPWPLAVRLSATAVDEGRDGRVQGDFRLQRLRHRNLQPPPRRHNRLLWRHHCRHSDPASDLQKWRQHYRQCHPGSRL